MRVLVLVGMPGSGKEEFISVAKQNGFNIVRMGDIVRDEAIRRGLDELTDKNLGELAHLERETYGYGIWATRTIPQIKGKLTLIDGCRGNAEIDVFRQSFGTALTIVGIFSSPSTRFHRLKLRKRADYPLSLEDFNARDQREIKWGIGNAFALVDHTIVNEGSIEEFRCEVEKMIERLVLELQNSGGIL